MVTLEIYTDELACGSRPRRSVRPSQTPDRRKWSWCRDYDAGRAMRGVVLRRRHRRTQRIDRLLQSYTIRRRGGERK